MLEIHSTYFYLGLRNAGNPQYILLSRVVYCGFSTFSTSCTVDFPSKTNSVELSFVLTPKPSWVNPVSWMRRPSRLKPEIHSTRSPKCWKSTVHEVQNAGNPQYTKSKMLEIHSTRLGKCWKSTVHQLGNAGNPQYMGGKCWKSTVHTAIWVYEMLEIHSTWNGKCWKSTVHTAISGRVLWISSISPIMYCGFPVKD